MHEAAIISQLHDQVVTSIRARMPDEGQEDPEPIGRLTTVHIRVGELEHLDDEVMNTVWKAYTMDTFLHGADLEIMTIPLSVACRQCAHEYVPEDPAILLCPQCHHIDPDVKQGTGIILHSIVIDEPVEETA
ncbi:MAG: hydrogenase maturation nickel metallochaperone HypA [Planctomycetes bacterium]|nr:hydrogenase maturation nickel metallochaperone HypA [Planctomycetota bacterium]